MGKPADLLQGTMDLLILRTLGAGPKHGWAIAKRIGQVSDDVLQVTQGSLYPALHRLEQQAWLSAEWERTDGGRMRVRIKGVPPSKQNVRYQALVPSAPART